MPPYPPAAPPRRAISEGSAGVFSAEFARGTGCGSPRAARGTAAARIPGVRAPQMAEAAAAPAAFSVLAARKTADGLPRARHPAERQ